MAEPQESNRNASPWSRRENAGRMLWAIVYHCLFRKTFHSWYGLRVAILRHFGAKIGCNVRIRRTAKIEIPWNIRLDDDVSIGEEVKLYSLGPIHIGPRSFVSQYAHLCAGSHDYTRLDYPLLRPPIKIGQDCWIAADAFIGPGVTIGDRSVVGARTTVMKDIPPDQIAAGSPVRIIGRRELTG